MESDYKKFFEKMEDQRIRSNFYEHDESFTVEELYHAFKARLIAELIERGEHQEGD